MIFGFFFGGGIKFVVWISKTLIRKTSKSEGGVTEFYGDGTVEFVTTTACVTRYSNSATMDRISPTPGRELAGGFIVANSNVSAKNKLPYRR